MGDLGLDAEVNAVLSLPQEEDSDDERKVRPSKVPGQVDTRRIRRNSFDDGSFLVPDDELLMVSPHRIESIKRAKAASRRKSKAQAVAEARAKAAAEHPPTPPIFVQRRVFI